MGYFKLILLAGAGGFIGSALRYSVTLLMDGRFKFGFPFATLSVNILGSFVIGLLIGISINKGVGHNFYLTDPWKVFLATGICGGFTTFSAFSVETFKLFEQGESMLALIYITSSVILGLMGVFAGIMATR
jgi:fluoride exporter